MAQWSQPLTEKHCSEILHPGIPCHLVPFSVTKLVLPGVMKFFAVMYIAQHLFMKKQLTQDEILKILKNYVRSVVFGVGFGATIFMTICLQCRLLGKITRLNLSCISGLCVLFNTPYRRPVETFAFLVMAIETMIRAGASNGFLPKSNSTGALTFMTANSLIFYLMWMKLNKSKPYSINWLLKPSKQENNNSPICYHNGPCWTEALKTAQKYSLVGLIISAVKLIPKIKDGNLSDILRPRTFKLAAFFGSYVLSYKVVNCSLNNFYGRESAIHAAIAGFIAGTSYLIRPTISLPVTAFTILSMCGWEEIKKNIDVPKLPYTEIIFIISNSLLLYYLFNHHKYLPRFFTWMIIKGTNDGVNHILKEIWSVDTL